MRVRRAGRAGPEQGDVRDVVLDPPPGALVAVVLGPRPPRRCVAATYTPVGARRIVGTLTAGGYSEDQCPDGRCLGFRRNAAEGEPFLSVDDASVVPYLPVEALNAGAAALERALARPLFAFRSGGRASSCLTSVTVAAAAQRLPRC